MATKTKKKGEKAKKKKKAPKFKRVDMKNLMPKGVAIKKSKAGLALFAKEPIERGDFIIEYVGKILTGKEADIQGGRYLFEVNSKKTIDGTPRYNTARYINHSCKPNCEPETKQGRVLIFAKKSIAVGEELNYDYGKEYCDEFLVTGGCICGNCSGKTKYYKPKKKAEGKK